MKISRYTLIAVMVIFNCTNLFSQSTAVTGETLWLKNQNEQSAQRNTGDQSSTYFNFNPIFSPLPKDLLHKNVLSAKYSLFIVFKSDVKQENNLFRLNSNGKETQITNNQIISSKNTEFNKKVDVTDGIVLGYIVSTEEKKNRKKNQLLIENLSTANSGTTNRNDMMELLYYPRILEIDEKQKVESYLSVKYGISLLGNTNYVNSEGGKIWNYEYNKSFNNRVTGIGRDDVMKLNQKQSGNAKKDGLYIGFSTIQTTNALNKTALPDKTFLLWGDNNAATTITADKNDTGGVKKMKRIWKLQSSSEKTVNELPTQLLLSKNEMVSLKTNPADKKEDFLWLAIDRNGGTSFDYQNADYYKLSAEDDEKVLFNNIVWDTDESGSDSFTFIKAPDFFVAYAVASPNCIASQEGKMDLKIVGGKAPYTIDVKAPGYQQSFDIPDTSFSIPDMTAANYTVHVTDNNSNEQTDTLAIDSFSTIAVEMAQQWYLDSSNERIIQPVVTNPDNEKLSFEWKFEGRTVATEKQFTADREGNYTLLLTNAVGCTKEFSFRVDTDSALTDTANGWVIYPNPVQRDHPFTIRFNLKQAVEVSVALYDLSNKLISNKKIGLIKELEYSDTLSLNGTFMVVVTANGIAQSAKLIIQ